MPDRADSVCPAPVTNSLDLRGLRSSRRSPPALQPATRPNMALRIAPDRLWSIVFSLPSGRISTIRPSALSRTPTSWPLPFRWQFGHDAGTAQSRWADCRNPSRRQQNDRPQRSGAIRTPCSGALRADGAFAEKIEAPIETVGRIGSRANAIRAVRHAHFAQLIDQAPDAFATLGGRRR